MIQVESNLEPINRMDRTEENAVTPRVKSGGDPGSFRRRSISQTGSAASHQPPSRRSEGHVRL